MHIEVALELVRIRKVVPDAQQVKRVGIAGGDWGGDEIETRRDLRLRGGHETSGSAVLVPHLGAFRASGR